MDNYIKRYIRQKILTIMIMIIMIILINIKMLLFKMVSFTGILHWHPSLALYKKPWPNECPMNNGKYITITCRQRNSRQKLFGGLYIKYTFLSKFH